MGGIHHVAGMFRGVNYNRYLTDSVKEKMEAKVVALDAKILERKGRVEKIMVEQGITHEAMGDMLVQYMKDQEKGTQRFQYSTNAAPSPGAPKGEVMIPAGIISNLVTEKNLIESETEEAKRLRLILRNLRNTELFYHPQTGQTESRRAIHTLSDDELEYLGF
jgi:hypothetical protein